MLHQDVMNGSNISIVYLLIYNAEIIMRILQTCTRCGISYNDSDALNQFVEIVQWHNAFQVAAKKLVTLTVK